MIKIAICDDEYEMCIYLNQKISYILDELKLVFDIKIYTNPIMLYNSNINFDIIFLDIQMPDFNGMQLAKKIREKENNCILIFITALKEYMPAAFEVEASDYIIKPVDEVHLKNTLNRVLKRINSNKKGIFIQISNKYIMVEISSIYYCEVIGRKIYFHTKNGILDFYGNFKDIEKQLGDCFIKCHRSYLFNINYLKEYNSKEIILENSEAIPVSRLRRKELLKTIMDYFKKEK